MKEFLNYIREYSLVLKEGAIWHNSKDILAPVIGNTDKAVAVDNYIYEFYCYISIIIDLRKKYEIKFVEGSGLYKYKFPQAAANKKGKPRFHAFRNGMLQFQICAGTKINCQIDSEQNHPDISFQIADASDDPSEKDLILIMDAKYKEGIEAVLPKDEVYKFGLIVDLFDLRKELIATIDFEKYKDFQGNCLITNGKAYSDTNDIRLLKKYSIKEVEGFYPGQNFNVLG
jgi:hypothetical protein